MDFRPLSLERAKIALVGSMLAFGAVCAPAFAQHTPQQHSPIGRWQSVDDATGKAKAVIEVYDTADGKVAAKIVKLIDTSKGPNPVCKKCDGSRKGKPMLGMVIAWGLQKDGDSWAGGRILDPEKGKEYSAKITPSADGTKLEVRGFIGFSLLGRTQVWLRAQ